MSRLLGSSKVTARYQVTIPDEARKILKVKEGQVIAFVEENGRVILKTEL
ncbi:MAG: type II toxin-antitoxin system PrlF family antitoxin [Nitrososphaera sp.]|jgi:AbrB family looped-hinge helix DNA binding protein